MTASVKKLKKEPVSPRRLLSLVGTFGLAMLLNCFVIYLCLYVINPGLPGLPVFRFRFSTFWIGAATAALVLCVPSAVLNYRYFAKTSHSKKAWYAKVCILLGLVPWVTPSIAALVVKLTGGL